MTSVSTDQLLANIAAAEAGAGTPEWGTIEGDLANQADLSAALAGKANSTDLDGKLDEPTGTPSATNYARGDGTWATPPNTTYSPISQANIENPASTASGLVTGQRAAQAIAAYLIGIAGYDAAETQSLKNVAGVLTWVTDTP